MWRPPLDPTPPDSGAPRLEQMQFLKKNYVYFGSCLLPLLIIGLIWDSTFVLIVCIAGWALEFIGLGVLQLQMRRERQKLSGE